LELRTLGSTGLRVARLALGVADLGELTDEEEGIRVVRHALDSGIVLFDTANAYVGGLSESILGRALAGRRDEAVVSTKFGGRVGAGPDDCGGGRRHVLEQVEHSLRRLRTDRIDLYQIHHPDPATPIEETLEALDLLVRSGKVRHVGCSNFHPAQLAEALDASERRGLVRFATEQVPYHLLDRRIERELLALALRRDVVLLPYSPLAQGMLAGRYAADASPPPDSRFARLEDWRARFRGIPRDAFDRVQAIRGIATRAGIPLAQLAVAWALRDPAIPAVLVGARTPAHLDALLPAIGRSLDAATLDALDAVNPPGGFAWFD